MTSNCNHKWISVDDTTFNSGSGPSYECLKCGVDFGDQLGARPQHFPCTPPADCDGKEQPAFEAWAKSQRYDMHEHPLHYLFMDPKTAAARAGWKAALAYVRAEFAGQASEPVTLAVLDDMDTELARMSSVTIAKETEDG